MTGLMLHTGGSKIERQNLVDLPTPTAVSASHTIIPHVELVDRVLESLAYRRIGVVKDEYAIARDGAHMFGMLTLDITNKHGVNLVMGLRNSHDKTFVAALVAGFRVFICDNLAFHGDFMPMSLRHSKHFMQYLPDALTLGVDKVQRKFQDVEERITRWQDYSLTDREAESIIYRAFVKGELDAAERLASDVHKEYFAPEQRHEEFAPRNLWSLHNAFTETFKQLKPVPQYKALASLDGFLEIN